MPRSHRLLAAAALTLALAVAASRASAGSLARPVHRSDSGVAGGGVEGVTLLRLHGGFSLPTGDFGDAFDTGLGFGANIAHGVGRNLLLSGGVAYHSFDGDGFGGDAHIVPITFNIESVFPSGGKIKPWIGGGVGLYNIDINTGTIVIPFFGPISASASETNFGVNFGGGIAARTGTKGVWGVGLKFHHVFEGDTFGSIDFMQLHGGYGFFL